MSLQPRPRRHRSPADVEAAYRHWRQSGSLRATAHALCIAEGTVIAWCRTHGWVQRRRDEDAFDAQIVREHATGRLIHEADALVDRLLFLSEEAKSDAVKLNAVKHALALLGIVPPHPAGRTGPDADRYD